MDERTRDIVDYTVFWIGVGMVILSLVGEVLGWWGDLGLLIGIVGLGATAVTLFDAHGRRAVHLLVGIQGGISGLQDGISDLQEGISGLQEGQSKLLDHQEHQEDALDRIQRLLDERLPEGV